MGFGQRWSPSSFGIAGLVGRLVAGADPATGVVIAAAFGALAAGREELADLTNTLYDLATSHSARMIKRLANQPSPRPM